MPDKINDRLAPARTENSNTDPISNPYPH